MMGVMKDMAKQADRWVAVVCCLYLVYLTFHFPPVKDNRAIIHDVTSYYGYLPAKFIYNDINFGFADTLPKGEPLDALWYNSLPNGQRFQKMTLGLAYFFAPGFFIADSYVKRHPEWNRNGFSKPYQWAMMLNTLLFGMFCVWLLMVLLRKYFSSGQTAVVLIIIFGTTNLPYYISMAPGLSHVYSFFLLCAQWLISLRLKEKVSVARVFGLILVTSWLILIRPTNALPALLPLFIIPGNQWMAMLRTGWMAGLPAFFIIWAPQMLYWHHVSGHWVFYSYDQERFFFGDSKIWEGLLGFRKGWLIYAPVMIFSLFGIFLKNPVLTRYRLFLGCTLPVYVYVVFSWWCWWYGGSYGSRVMIEYYPVLALFLGSFIQSVSRKKVMYGLSLVFIGFLLWLNQIQLRQFHGGILHWDSMTYPAYKAIFFDRIPPANYGELLKTPDYEAAKKGLR